MQVPKFLVVAILCGVIVCRFAAGQNSEVISRNPEADEKGKVTVNFGDLVVEVKPPLGREGVVTSQPFYERWQNVDDVAYWEAIYGSMDDIPAFEDLPDIAGETVQLEDVKEWEPEYSNDKPNEIFVRDPAEVPVAKSLDAAADSSRTCERINPFCPKEKSWFRRRREISVTKSEEPETEESINPSSSLKRKGRTLSLLQSGLEKSRFKSNLRSDYLLNKYGWKSTRSHKYGRVAIPVAECIDDRDIAPAAGGSVKFVDSAISAAELVNTGTAKTSQVDVGTTANAARQLAQAKREVIDLGHRATQAIALGSLNNAAADCEEPGEEALGAAVATNIDGGLEVVGNSVLDTNSGIINAAADPGISVGIAASHDVGTSAATDTLGSIVDTDASASASEDARIIADSTSELSVDEDAREEIAAAENQREIDLQEAEIVGEKLVTREILADAAAHVETPNVLDGKVAISSHAESAVAVATDSEASVGSSLSVRTESEAHASARTKISTTGSKANVDTGGRSHRIEHARRIFGSEDLTCECALEADRDREFYPRHRYYHDAQGDDDFGRRFQDGSGHRASSRDYYRGQRSGVDADAGIQSSIDPGIGERSSRDSANAATAVSVDLDSNLDAGSSRSGIHGESDVERSRSNRRAYGYDHDRFWQRDEFDSAEEFSDFDSEEYREYRRRFPGQLERRRHGSRSGIHANSESHAHSEIHANSGTRANSGIHANSESHAHSEVHTNSGTHSNSESHAHSEAHASSGTRTNSESYANSEAHANSGIHASLGAAVGASSNHGSVHTASSASASVNVDTHVGSTTSGVRSNSGVRTSLDAGLNVNSHLHGSRGRGGDGGVYDDYDGIDDVCVCGDSEEYGEYRRRYPGDRFRPDRHHRGRHNSGVHGSLDAGASVNSGLRGVGRRSGIRAESAVHSSIDAGIDLDANVAGVHSHAGSRASANVDSRVVTGNTRPRQPGGNYRGYGGEEDVLADYDDYDDEEYRRFRAGRYGKPERGGDSGIRGSSGIHTSVNAEAAAAGGVHAAAKSSVNVASHVDIGATTSAINGAINSALRADAGIHTSLDAGLGANGGHGGGFHGGMKSSVDLDSHLDIGARRNGGASGTGEAGEKICEAVCRGTADFRKHDCCPSSRFALGKAPDICDNCGGRLYSQTDDICPGCGRRGSMFGERRPFLSRGTIYHFDDLKQNCKRTAGHSADAEPQPENTRGYSRYINLDANCTDDASRLSPDCQGLDYSLETPRGTQLP